MKYLCLVHEGNKEMDATRNRMSEDECLALGGALPDRDYPAAQATTVRVRNGRVSVTDGSLAGTEERLPTFFLIEAKDLNDAIRVAAKLPAAHYGGVELRPINELNPRYL